MQFPLLFTEQLTGLAPAQQKQQILATNQTAFTQYGIKLTPQDAEMILAADRDARAAEQLVLFGEGIAPRLIRWFLPSGYLAGQNYAGAVAALVEAFYRLRSELQEICDEARTPECALSDNAILDYMYRFYTSPQCAGDTEEMLAIAERILLPAMHRLTEKHAAEAKARRKQQGSYSDTRLLYADRLAEESELSALEQDAEETAFDHSYRSAMRRDVFGQYEADYAEDPADRFRGSDAEELERMLLRFPELLLPSSSQEAEWEDRAAKWEEEDAE